MDRQEFIDDCLREHNVYRLSHGVTPLRYSISLDKSAQEWATELIDKDTLQNSPISSRGEVGENISSRSSSSAKVSLCGSDVAKQWYGDIKNYDFVKSCGAAGNFTQMIWKSSEEVGFGVAHSKGKCVVVAHYRPAGNVKGKYICNVLPPVNSDVIFTNLGIHEVKVAVTEGECCYLRESKECIMPNLQEEVWTEELCVYKTPSSRHRTDSMSSDENFELDLHLCTDFQKAHKRQLRTFVRETISAINKYRTLHGVPKLKHNSQLDKLSQTWAEELCTKSALSNSNNKYNGDRVGESVASRWSTGKCDYSAHEIADHWYAEHKKYNFRQEPPNVQGIGNFTQMLWKSTTEIGIGKAFLTKGKETRVIVVCNYYPAGNVLKHFMENVFLAKE